MEEEAPGADTATCDIKGARGSSAILGNFHNRPKGHHDELTLRVKTAEEAAEFAAFCRRVGGQKGHQPHQQEAHRRLSFRKGSC